MNVIVTRQKVVPVIPPVEKITIELDVVEANLLKAMLESIYVETDGTDLNYFIANATFRQKVAENPALRWNGTPQVPSMPERSFNNRIISPIVKAISEAK